MRASSTNLDIEIKLSKEETAMLKEGKLSGTLDFSDEEIKIENKHIPFILEHLNLNKEQIDVTKYPEEGYFGLCESFHIKIYNSFYDDLLRRGSCGDRFYFSGKIIIETK